MGFYELLAKTGFTDLETRFAAWAGTFYRERILKDRPLEGTVGEIFMTRQKLIGLSKNYIWKGLREPATELEKKSGNIVYQARFKINFLVSYGVLSLFYGDLRFVGKRIRITNYDCIIHIGHIFFFGNPIEIYPKTIKEVEDGT